MAKLVRCPKCHKLLVEFPNIPAYQCGGCGIDLCAKNHCATEKIVAPGSPQTNHPESHSDHGFSDSGSASSIKEMIPSPSRKQCPELEKGVESTIPSLNSDHIGGSQIFETENQRDEFIQDDIACDLNDQQDEKPLKLSKPDCLSLTHEVEQSPDSIAHYIVSEKMVDIAQHEGFDHILKSPATINSHAYYDSVSCDDGCGVRTRDRSLCKSRRTFRYHRVSVNVGNKDTEGEDALGNNKKAIYTGAKLKSRSLASTSSNERNNSGLMRSFNAIEDGISSKLGGRSSFDSEEFHSAQNWMASEKEGPSGIRSFKGDMYEKMELLRKIDEVRDQLAKLCVPRKDTRRYTSTSMHEQHNQRFHEHIFGHPIRPSHHAQVNNRFQMKHFSEQSSHCYCLQCLEEQQRLDMLPNFHGHGMCRAHAHKLDFPSSRSGSSSKYDHNLEKSHSKVKPKHHCRPISGAAPFVICYKCMKLLQLPADFHISRRKVHKLQCGACAEVLELSHHE